MATNTADSSTEHTGNGSTTSFSISFTYLSTAEIDVKVNNVVKSIGSDYTISGQTLTFDSAPTDGHVISIKRDTNIGSKKVDFEDGSVLTETDLDNNTNQLLFGIQEIADDYVKRDGSQTITGDIIFEGSADDANETTLSITNPTADRTITVPDRSGTIITSGDTGTVTSTMITDGTIVNADINNSANIAGTKLADDSVTLAKLGSGALPTDITVASANIVDGTIVNGDIANTTITGAKLANDTITSTQIGADAITASELANNAVDTNAVQDDAITYSKLQNVSATDRVLGRDSSGAGVVEEITPANLRTMINVEDGATADQSASEIRTLIASDPLTATHLAANSVDSSELVDGSVDHSHLSNDCVDGDNVQDNSIDNEHIAANAVRVNEIKDGEITSAKLNPSAVITSSEQGSATTNDTSFLTSAAADARFFNISSGDTIKDGQTFPDNDTTIATTAAINDRIIDIVNDVGGFDIVESEQHFPNDNPQGQAGSAAVLSVKAATTNLVPSGTTLTIVNGNIADNANITITGVTSTIPSGFGFIVESTNTLHEYAFHRLVPKATEVTTVAGKAVEIGRLGTADAVADMAILGTTDVVADMNTLATADIVSDMNTLATTDVVNDMNTLAVTSVINNMDTVATNVTNVNNVGNNITNVNNLTNSTGANQTFTVTVQNVSGNKYFIDGVQTPVLKLARGKTYTFNLADSSNSGHPLAFRDSSDNSYTTGVTTSGTAGSSGATVVIVVAANAPSSLKYYCTSHGNAMGNTINVIDDNVGAVAGALTNIGNVAGALTNVNNVGNSISNVNTVANNLSSVNSFANTYRIGSTNPTTSLDTGDLFFNTTTDSLKVYTGSAWVDGVTQTGNFALKTGNTFTGSNIHNDNVKSIYGTGSDLEIYHDGTSTQYVNGNSNSFIKTGLSHYLRVAGNEAAIDCLANTNVKLYYDNSVKLQTESGGAETIGTHFATKFSSTNTSTPPAEFTSSVTSNEAGLLLRRSSETNGDYGGLEFHNHPSSITSYRKGGIYFQANGTGFGRGEMLFCNDIVGDSSNVGVGDVKLKLDASGNIQIPNDSGKLQLGAGQDLQLYHDGTNNYISGTTNTNIRITTNNTNRWYFANDGHLRPEANQTYDIGSTAQQVKQVYAKEFIVLDNGYFKAGTLADLQIYHNGTNSIISNNTGNLNILATSTETAIQIVPNAEVSLWYDNSKKFETTSTGSKVTGDFQVVGGGIIQTLQSTSGNQSYLKFINSDTGSGAFTDGLLVGLDNDETAAFWLYENKNMRFATNGTERLTITSDGNLRIPADNQKLQLGAGQDLDIYHDGTNSYIQNSTGDLILKAAFPTIQGANGETILNAGQNGAVNLYYDNSKKLETTSNGISVGSVTIDSGFNNIGVPDGGSIRFGTGEDLKIYHDGSNSFIQDSGTGSIVVNTSRLNVANAANSEAILQGYQDGQCELYYDNSKKLETDANGVTLTGRLSATANVSAGTYVYSGGQVYSDNFVTATTHNSSILRLKTRNASGTEETLFKGTNDGAAELYYDSTKKFETISTGVKVSSSAHANLRLTSADNSSASINLGPSSDYDAVQIWYDDYANALYYRTSTNTPQIWYTNGTQRLVLQNDGHLRPYANNTYDLGTSSYRWANVYTNDLNLSNEGGANDVDGTWGSYTIQEGAEDLFLVNKRNGKKYKFNLTEVS